MFKIAKIEYADLPTHVPSSSTQYATCKWWNVPLEYIDQIRSKLALEGPAANHFTEYLALDNRIYSVDGFVDIHSSNSPFHDYEYQRATDKVAYLLSKLKFRVVENKLPQIKNTLTEWRSKFALDSFIGKSITLDDLPIAKMDDFTKPHYEYKDSKLVLTLNEFGNSFGAFAYTTNRLAVFATLHLTTVNDTPITKWCTHCGSVA